MKKILNSLLLLTMAVTACNIDETTVQPAPVIRLDSETGIYTVKVGKTILLAPEYDHAEEATYSWILGDTVLSTGPTLVFRPEEAGEFFLVLTVENGAGRDRTEIRIDVTELELPRISFEEAAKGYRILTGYALLLTPTVDSTSLPTACRWYIDGEQVSDMPELVFRKDEAGTYLVRFETRNEDGEDRIEFPVQVLTETEMPLEWTFRQTLYRLSSGRSIRIAPATLSDAEGWTFRWLLNGEEVSGTEMDGKTPCYIFRERKTGRYSLRLEASKSLPETQLRCCRDLTVEVCPEEGTFRRPCHAGSSASSNRVYAYVPAPGQFIHETSMGFGEGTDTPEKANAYAEKRLAERKLISLGGFGGYIVVGFDHSVGNRKGYDFSIADNAFTDGSEPGIVWVMQDENGDGLPNDTWYELQGSESGKKETLADYGVTYYRPEGPNRSVRWTDNLGHEGYIEYLPDFHRQPYYYPQWIAEDSYTLYGTRLKERNRLQDGLWINADYGWGYADNFSLADKENDSRNANRFDISRALRYDGQSISLQYIDFIKVQTGVHASSGRLGELSTEIVHFTDLSLQ